MEFRVLGPVELRVGGRLAPTGEPRQRAVLAVLLLEAGRAVSTDTLVDRVWGESPPRQVRRSLYSHIARIRRGLDQAIRDGPAGAADQPLIRTSGGYLLDVDPEQVDVLSFRGLLARGRDAGASDRDRAAALRSALDLWRGEALSGIRGAWADRTRQALGQEHIDAMVAWAHAEIRCGQAATVVVPLTELADEHPLLESAAAALMRALYAVGRGSDALDRYGKIRRHLRDELGVDPGPELREVHQAVLRQELPQPTRAQAVPSPAELPADVAAFTGRASELADLDRLLAATAGGPALIICITGTAGAGKTNPGF